MGETSAKIYSMWNGQNPCGIGGQGKDLLSGCLLVFDVFGVSRDTQSNLGFFRTKPLVPDDWRG